MPRPRMPWFKLYTRILYSSINYELTLEEFGCFVKILAFCAEMGGNGVIADGESQPLPHRFIAEHIHVPLEVLDSTIDKCKATNRLSENSNGIVINKWKEYQSEYQRQKPYREAKAGKPIHKICPECSYKGVTNETNCPECGAELQKDYKGGKYGHLIQS